MEDKLVKIWSDFEQIKESGTDNVQISTRKGKGGQVLSYVPGKEYIFKLLKLTGRNYQWIIDKQEVQGNNDVGYTVVTIGYIEVDGIKRYGVGEEVVRMTKDGKEMANEPWKSSETDALKRAAEKWGIHLDLSLRIQREQIEEIRRLINTPETLQKVPKENLAKIGEAVFDSKNDPITGNDRISFLQMFITV
jgi:hypothetical protein